MGDGAPEWSQLRRKNRKDPGGDAKEPEQPKQDPKPASTKKKAPAALEKPGPQPEADGAPKSTLLRPGKESGVQRQRSELLGADAGDTLAATRRSSRGGKLGSSQSAADPLEATRNSLAGRSAAPQEGPGQQAEPAAPPAEPEAPEGAPAPGGQAGGQAEDAPAVAVEAATPQEKALEGGAGGGDAPPTPTAEDGGDRPSAAAGEGGGSDRAPDAQQEPAEPEPEPEQHAAPAEELGGPAAAAEIVKENERLKAQIESLQRIMASGSQDAKLRRLTEDLATKAKLVKELEGELEKQKKEAARHKADAEKAKKDLAAAQKHPRVDSVKGGGGGADAAKLRELEAKLQRAEARAKEAESAAAAAHAQRRGSAASSAWSDGPSKRPAPPAAAAARSPPADAAQVASLRQQLEALQSGITARDTAIRQLTLKLERAQEAITGSAGIGWESDVKLHQTKSMLQRLLRDVSPKAARAALSAVSPSPPRAAQPTPRTTELPSPQRASGCMCRDVDGKVVYLCASTDRSCAPELVRFVNGVRAGPVVGPLRCRLRSDGVAELTDGGAPSSPSCIVRLPGAAIVEGTLKRVAQLCDACGVAHDIAPPQPAGGSSLSGPLSPPSPYGYRAGSMSPVRSPTPGARGSAGSAGVWQSASNPRVWQSAP
eukprot:TRINITY_DN5086_c0_g1_i1.p1 TRINITY_DN5086_c0_g1~~TRINITY_DN5086_c0_g1_i1.p1  ORF type:complete len:678 (+),score=207.93 TRINITY_DN5086_c0_g1_i1:67-2034(+)